MPALPLYFHKRVKRGKENPTRLPERFGYSQTPRPNGTVLWLHAASVGELQSLLPLIHKLLTHNANLYLLITTGTLTSAHLFEQEQLPRCFHQFTPVDTWPAVRRFLQHWQPDALILTESELWPCLLSQTQKHGIPTALINARISEKSFQKWQRLRALIAPLLKQLHPVIAGSQKDAERFAALCGKKVSAIANLKLAAPALKYDEAALTYFQSMVGRRPMILAASTHDPEEYMLAEITETLRQQHPDLLLIIAPRHAARGETIAAELRARGATVAQRSQDAFITADTQIYLADTMGELGLFYRACPIAFIGGSLIPHGGQNLLEAARLDTAILSGPSLFNFAEIAENFVQHQALCIAQTPQALAVFLEQLLADPGKQHDMAQRALALAQQANHALEDTWQHLQPLLQQALSTQPHYHTNMRGAA